MKSILSIFFSISFFFCQAQKDTIYEFTYGGINDDYARQIISTSDSGYIIVGTTSSFGVGASDVYVIKTDSNCNRQWSKVYGTSAIEWGYSVRQTLDNGYILTGFTNQDTSKGYDIYLVKIDAAGTFQWSKSIGGTDWDFGYGIELTQDSGFIICGKTWSYSNGGSDIYLVKCDLNGGIVWQKNYGGPNDESANAIMRDRNFNFIVIGVTKSYGAGDNDIYVLKINNNGDTLWTKPFGTTKFDAGYGIDTTLDGNYVLIGTSFGDPNDTVSSQMYFLKIDSNGTFLWSQMQGGNLDEEGRIVKQLPNNEFFTGGMTKSFGLGGKSVYLLICDANGGFIDGNNPGGTDDDEGYSLALGKGDHFAIAGISDSYGCGHNDAFLLRFDTLAIKAYHPPSFSFQCDSPIGTNEIADQGGNYFLIYPNPAKDYFSIEIGPSFLNRPNSFVNIVDITGRITQTITVNESPLILKRTDNLSSGIYFLSLFIENTLYHTDKLVLY